MRPESYLYSEDHEWMSLVNGIASVGITDYAGSELGDVVYVDLPEIGKAVVKGESMFTVESVKAVSDIYEFDGCAIDFSAHECVDKNKERRELSKKEAALLRLLIEHEGEVVSREQILQIVWGYNVYPTTRTIDNFILNFRKFFEKDSRNPKHFHSIRGIGYKFTK